jgi:hypothetical protein
MLRQNPGQWMRVGEYTSRGSATSFTSRLCRAATDVEATIRTIEDGVVVAYARVAVNA